MSRRRVFAAGLASALVFSVGLHAQADKKTEDALKKEAQALSKLADAALAGQVGSNDFNVAWVKEDFLRAPKDKQQFVPFTISLDPTKVTGENLTLYWRVVPTPSGAAPADTGKKNDKQQVKPVWEGVSLLPVAGVKSPLRVSRSFVGLAGSYDVYVVAKELQVEKPKNGQPAKTVVLKQTVIVPDLWSELATSSVIVYERIEPLAAPLTPQQAAERPYAMGTVEIIPFANLKLSKKAELAMLMFVYNPKGDSANKPDVTVEYNFCQSAPGNQPAADEPCKAGEKYYNRTDPVAFNSQTVDPQFDVKVQPIQTGQAVPLAGFPEGDYRLEIKVTDKLANRVVTRDVNFTVSPS
jgi:hypothetical protein